MSDQTITPIPTTTPTIPASIPIKSLIRPLLTVLVGGVLGFGGAKFAGTHQDDRPQPVKLVTNVVTNTVPAGSPQRLQVLTLLECQYWISENPFFMLHLPKCTNHPAGK